jgi:RNA 2',3'-cyclic 3'-phosphodiesterase
MDLRAFIALEMPREVAVAAGKARLALEVAGIRLRWVHPENIHLTLRFLGDVPEKDIPGLGQAMGEAATGVSPFSLKVKGVGVFPGMSRPSVVFMGLEGEKDRLAAFYRTLSECLVRRGIPLEKRPFQGHLTIGRVKDRIDSERFARGLASCAKLSTEIFPVDALTLFKSDLMPKGPVYTPLATVRLQ